MEGIKRKSGPRPAAYKQEVILQFKAAPDKQAFVNQHKSSCEMCSGLSIERVEEWIASAAQPRTGGPRPAAHKQEVVTLYNAVPDKQAFVNDHKSSCGLCSHLSIQRVDEWIAAGKSPKAKKKRGPLVGSKSKLKEKNEE